jgi:hypothetical protein
VVGHSVGDGHRQARSITYRRRGSREVTQGDEFATRLISTGQLLTQDRFVDRLEGAEWQFLSQTKPATRPGRLGQKPARSTSAATPRAGSWPAALKQRSAIWSAGSCALLKAGWTEVVVVTDHGWLLMPGGLPKVELKAFLTETRWSRCAALKAEAQDRCALAFKWHWNPEVMMASPPGAGSFRASIEYSHGGVSLQEMVTPVLRVQARSSPTGGSARCWKPSGPGRSAACRSVATVLGVRVDVRTSQIRPEHFAADGQAGPRDHIRRQGDRLP